MKPSTHPQRVSLNAAQEGVVTCQHCGLEKTMNLTHYPVSVGGQSVKIRCKKCATVFYVTFDYRRYQRLNVGLPGTLCQGAALQADTHILVTSLSVAGVGFVVSDASTLHLADVLEIAFHLDDECQSVIQEPITVRRISGVSVGAEYAHDAYRHELDFYVTRTVLLGAGVTNARRGPAQSRAS